MLSDQNIQMEIIVIGGIVKIREANIHLSFFFFDIEEKNIAISGYYRILRQKKNLPFKKSVYLF